jgi:hypothetical protein
MRASAGARAAGVSITLAAADHCSMRARYRVAPSPMNAASRHVCGSADNAASGGPTLGSLSATQPSPEAA